MGSERPRITMDLFTQKEVEFFKPLPKKKWPQLLRAILRDAIREGRAHVVKRGTQLDFSDDLLPMSTLEDASASLVGVAPSWHNTQRSKSIAPAPDPAAAVAKGATSRPADVASSANTAATVAVDSSPTDSVSTQVPTANKPVKSGSALKGFFGENLAHLRDIPPKRAGDV